MSESDTASRQLALALCWLLLLSAVGSVAPIGSATAAGNACTGITAGNTIDSPGCYVLNATNTSVTTSAAVEISANNVTLHGGGNTLAAGSSTAEAGVLATLGGEGRITNLTVRNLTVRGFNRSGLRTLNGSNITVENVTAGRNGEDGVRVSGGSGITVTNTTLLNNNQSGFDAKNGAEDILVRDTNASLTNQSAAGGFELGSSLANVTLENVTAVKNNGTGVVVFGNSSGVEIRSSVVTNNSANGVDIDNSTRIEIQDSQFTQNRFDGMDVTGSSGLDVQKSLFGRNEVEGLDIRNETRDVTIQSSRLVRNLDDGLAVLNRSQDVLIQNNEISRNQVRGVSISDVSSNVTLSESELINNSDAGLRALDSRDIAVRDTNASLQTANLSSNDTRVRDGVGFSNVTDGLIENLTAVGNTDAGVNIYDRSENVTVSGSVLIDNGDGLRADESRDITVRNTNASLNTVDEFSDGVGFVNTTDGVIENVTAVGNDRAGVALLDGTSNIAVSESRVINNNISGLNLVNSRNIAIEDTNASLNSGGNASDGIKFINATSSSAENITATANGQAGVGIFAGSANISVSKSRLVANDQAGIAALDSTNVSVRATNASLNTEASFASGVLFRNTTEGAIRDATAVGNNDTGVSLSAGTADVTVSGSRLISNRRAGLRALDSRNITVLNTNASLSTEPGSSGVNLTNVTDSSLDSLTAVRNNDTGVRLTSGSDNVTVSGGQFIANRQGVDVRNSSDIAVQNASITDSTGIAGVNISESRGVGVQTSDVRESRGDGVRIFESQEVTVSASDVQNSDTGVEVSGSPGLTISRTNVQDSRVTGILVADSADAAISNVTAENNTESGIKLAGATNSTISDSVTEANDGGIILTDLAVGAFAGATENNTITNVTASDNTVALAVGGGDAPAQNNTINDVDIGTAALSSVDARLFNISERAELPRPIPENWTRTGVQFDISAQQGAASRGGFVDLTVDISGEVNEVDPSSLDLWRYKLDEERWVRTNAEIDADAGTVSQRFNGSCCSPVALLRNETSDDDGGGGGNDGGDGGGGDSIQVSDPIGPGELDDQSESDSGPPLNLSTASAEFDEVRTSDSENTTLTLTNNGSQTVTVERVETTEPAFTPTQGRFSLDPGESETVLIRFEPDGPGTYNGSVRFETASRTLSASLTGVSLGDTSAEVNVSTTLGPDRRVVEATVTNPVPGDPVEIPLPGDRLERAEINAAFENLSLTPNVSEGFELRVVTSPAPLSTTPAFGPRETNGTVPLTFANITKTITDAELQTVTVRARVSKARLAELGARPETVVLFRYEGNRWVPKPTSVVAETERTVVVAATAAGLSEWTAAARRPQFNITDAVIDIRAPTVEDTVTIQTFIENTGGADGLYNAELLVNGSVVDQRRTSIPPGGTAQLNFRQLFEAPQTYEVRVNNFTVGAVTVNPQPDSGAAETATPTPSSEVSGLAPVAIGAVVALLVGVVLLVRVYRQRR